MQTILWLNLNSGIWAHSKQELAVLSALDPKRFKVILLSCDGVQTDGCHVRESKGRKLDDSRTKRWDCRNCLSATTAGANHLRRLGFQVNVVSLKLWFDSSQPLGSFSWPTEETEEFLIENYQMHGVALGRLAFYEWFLNAKSKSVNSGHITQDQRKRRYHSLRNAALVLEAFNRWLTSNEEKLDFAIAYAPQYSINNVILQKLAQEEPDCVQYFMEGSDNPADQYRRVRIWNWQKFGLIPPDRDLPFEDLALEPFSEKLYVSNHSQDAEAYAQRLMRQLSNASSFMVYSKRDTKTSRELLLQNIGMLGKRRIALFALSSFDEIHAALEIGAFSPKMYPGDVFESQFEAVAEVMKFYAANPSLGLILRLHPREFPDTRNKSFSDTEREWSRLLAEVPNNVYVNKPEDPWSLGDLITATDFLITGWSSAAIQAVLMGKEVVTYDENMGFLPKAIVSTGSSREDFITNLTSVRTSDELARRRSTLVSFLWRRHSELEVSAESTFRLSRPRIASNSALRKTFFAIEELFPFLFRSLELRLSPKAPGNLKKQLQRLFETRSDFIPKI